MVTPAEIMKSIGTETALAVARSALDDPSISTVNTIRGGEIGGGNDRRTVAILRVTGDAVAPHWTSPKPWSAILKVIDRSIESPGVSAWNYPELEEEVYRRRLFEDSGASFRSARCHSFIETPEGHFQIFLEDLTDAAQPPWSVQHYEETAYNLGTFNGRFAAGEAPPDDLELPQYNFANRWRAADHGARIRKLAAVSDSEIVRKIYTSEQLSSIVEAADYIDRFVEKASSLSTALAHGDSHARNLFPVNGRTVAIDWAGLSNEPVGADAGVLVGSGFTWGADEQAMVFEQANNFYGQYLSGLRDSGWVGDESDVRVGFFAQFGTYVFAISGFAGELASGIADDRRRSAEARFGIKIEDMPDRIARVSPFLLEYLAEFRSLAG